jgi:hypothetical protein
MRMHHSDGAALGVIAEQHTGRSDGWGFFATDVRFRPIADIRRIVPAHSPLSGKNAVLNFFRFPALSESEWR